MMPPMALALFIRMTFAKAAWAPPAGVEDYFRVLARLEGVGALDAEAARRDIHDRAGVGDVLDLGGSLLALGSSPAWPAVTATR